MQREIGVGGWGHLKKRGKSRGRQRVPVFSVTDHSRGCSAKGVARVPRHHQYRSNRHFPSSFYPLFPLGQVGKEHETPHLSFHSVLFSKFNQSCIVLLQPEHPTRVEWVRKEGLTGRRRGESREHTPLLSSSMLMSRPPLRQSPVREASRCGTKDQPHPLIYHRKTPKPTQTSTCHLRALRFVFIKLHT